MDAMLVVGLYVLVTAPMLALMLLVHGLQSDYTRLFLVALMLQIIPVGLIFFPLGMVGVAMLAFTLALTFRRNKRFHALGFHNPEVARRWRKEYLFNLWALGLALEQKGVAYLFTEVVAKHGFAFVWSGLLPLTVLVWGGLGWAIVRETRALKAIPAE